MASDRSVRIVSKNPSPTHVDNSVYIFPSGRMHEEKVVKKSHLPVYECRLSTGT